MAIKSIFIVFAYISEISVPAMDYYVVRRMPGGMFVIFGVNGRGDHTSRWVFFQVHREVANNLPGKIC